MNIKQKRYVFVLIVIIMLALLANSTVQHIQLKRAQILELQQAYFYLTTIQINQKGSADWNRATQVMGQFGTYAGKISASDCGKLQDLCQWVSCIQGDNPHREELVSAIESLTVAWDTRDWHWSATVIEGDIDQVIEEIKLSVTS